MNKATKRRNETEEDMDRARKCLESSVSILDDQLSGDQDWERCKRLLDMLCGEVLGLWIRAPSRMLGLLPYQDYLKTHHWKNQRSLALQNAGHRCQVCNSGDCELHTHHRHYDNLGFESRADLIVLCKGCHSMFHGKLADAATPAAE